jgi:adenosylcobyric acid synthase
VSKRARTLLVLGTASDVGKSTVVAGLCRIFADRGVDVAPFKAQNMARNAYVCADGSEIGVAQAVQALAARKAPSRDHNPILLKPEPGLVSQVIVHGRPIGTHRFGELSTHRGYLLDAVASSLARLRAAHDLVIIEGAGSPAEVNLQAHDIPNIATARLSEAEIVLVADIDRGGVFASLLGTLDLMPDDLRPRVRGFIINKLRGDASLLAPGVEFLRARTGLPVLGVVPHFEIALPDEDSVALARYRGRARAPLDTLEIAVVDTPTLANFEDVSPLLSEPGVHVRLTSDARDLLEADAVVLLGSKSTVHDLAFLRVQQIDRALRERAARRKPILAICGGAQMLSEQIDDPEHIESSASHTTALGLIPMVTRFAQPKVTHPVRGSLLAASVHAPDFVGAGEAPVDGFMLHFGRLERSSRWHAVHAAPALMLDGSGVEGCAVGATVATMVHRVLDHAATRASWLDGLRSLRGLSAPTGNAPASDPYDDLAACLSSALDLDALSAIALGAER